jgi:hypothetical protein
MVENLGGEIWKDVVGFEGLYQVSNYARFKSLPKIIRPEGRSYAVGERLIKSHVNKYGYVKVPFIKDYKKYNKQVHRMVALAFIPNPENLPQIDHIDGDRQNNHVSNLRWCTILENRNFPLSKKSHDEAIERQRIAVVQLTKDGEFIAEHVSMNQAGRDLDIAGGWLCKCIKNGKMCNGFWFMKKDNYEEILKEKQAC